MSLVLSAPGAPPNQLLTPVLSAAPLPASRGESSVCQAGVAGQSRNLVPSVGAGLWPCRGLAAGGASKVVIRKRASTRGGDDAGHGQREQSVKVLTLTLK